LIIRIFLSVVLVIYDLISHKLFNYLIINQKKQKKNQKIFSRVKELERIESEVIVPKHAYKPDNLKIVRGGDWKIEANQSVFYYKIKVSNQSKLVISKI